MAIDENEIACKARAAWDRDPKLRAEFADSFESYRAFAIADAKGLCRIIGRVAGGNSTSAIDSLARPSDAVYRAAAQKAWATDPAIRRDFISAENYASFLIAEREGKIKILGNHSHSKGKR